METVLKWPLLNGGAIESALKIKKTKNKKNIENVGSATKTKHAARVLNEYVKKIFVLEVARANMMRDRDT